MINLVNQTLDLQINIAVHIMGPLRPSGMERMFQSSAGKWEQNGWFPIIVGQGDENPFAQKLIDVGHATEIQSQRRKGSDTSVTNYQVKPDNAT